MSSECEMAFVDWCNTRGLSSSVITREAFAAGWRARPEPTAYIVPVKLDCFVALLKAAKEADHELTWMIDSPRDGEMLTLSVGHLVRMRANLRAAVEAAEPRDASGREETNG